MLTIIVSDDLSGAAGMASLIGSHIPVIPYNRIPEAGKLNSEIISIDLETRNLVDPLPRLDIVKHTFPGARILVRIDSLFRGSTLDFISFIKGYGNIILTDTIPEYGMYTFNGSSINRNGSINIIKMLPDRLKPYVKIADSQSYVDIKKLAKKCVDENLLPLDPGLLIKYYLEMV